MDTLARRMHLGLLVLLSCGCCFAESDPSGTITNRPIQMKVDVVVTATVANTSFQVGENILLKVALINVGKTNFVTRKSSPFGMFDIVVFGPDGARVPMTTYGQKQALGSLSLSTFLTLAPQETCSRTINVTRCFDLSIAGGYKISVNKTITTSEKQRTTLEGPLLEVSVTEKE